MGPYCQKATMHCPFPEILDETVVFLIGQDDPVKAVLM